MKKLLPVLLFAALFALAGCKKDGGNDTVEKIDVLVCMHHGGDGYHHIVAMLPDGSQKRYLFSETESVNPKQASIGSDGETLLLSCNDGRGVFTYNLRTQKLTQLTGEGYYEVPVFSPDMKKVYALHLDEVNDGTINKFTAIDVATKAATVLDDENSLIYPSFMNDGATMIVDCGWQESIASIKTDGTNLKILKEGDGDNWYRHPLSVPALNKVVYIKGTDDEETESDVRRVCLMNADGTGEVVLTPGVVRYDSPSVSSDGKTLAFLNNIEWAVCVTTLNGASIGTIRALTDRVDNIWRPQFNRIAKDVFESLPEFVKPTEN